MFYDRRKGHPRPAKYSENVVFTAGTRGQPGRRGRDQRTHQRDDLGRRSTVAADQRHRAEAGRLLGAEPRRDRPGRRRDWQAARAALEHLAGWGRHRDQRHPNRDRPGRALGRDLGRGERDSR